MKKNEDEIAELFRSRLSQHEIPLKEDLWKEIESELSKPSSKRIYIAAFVAIAAIFMLLLACSAAVKLFDSERDFSYSEVKNASFKRCVHPAAVSHKELKLNTVSSLTICESIPDNSPCIKYNKDLIENLSTDNTTPAAQTKLLSNLESNISKSEELIVEPKDVSLDNSWSVGVLASIEAKLHAPMSLGVSVSKKISNRVSLESGLQYSYSNTDRLEKNGEYFATSAIHSLGIPLKAKVEIFNKNKLSLYASGGVLIEKNIAANKSLTSNKDEKRFDIDRLETSLTSAIGLQYKVANNIGLFIESGLVYHIDNHTPLFAAKYDNPLNVNIACGMKIIY